MTDEEAEALSNRFLDSFTSPRTLAFLLGAVLFLTGLMVVIGVMR